MKNALLVCIISVVASACMQVRDMDEGVKSKAKLNSMSVLQNQVYESQVSDDIEFKLTSATRPGYYRMVFSWKKAGQLSFYDRGQKTILPQTQQQYSLIWPHSTEYAFTFERESGGDDATYVFQGKTPADIIIDKNLDLKKDLNLKAFRIFAVGEREILTNGLNLNLSAYEGRLEKLKIITHHQGQKADYDKEGRHGGLVHLDFTYAQGDLQAEMRGESGGDGSLAQAHTQRAKRGEAASGQRIRRGPDGVTVCYGKSTSNGDGANGLIGNPGKDGKRGGDSGLLRLNVFYPVNFRYEYKLINGEAGTPSRGGEGQLGGLAGETKIHSVSSANCGEPFMRGKVGQAGGVGPDGSFGEPGKNLLACINIQNKQPSCLK